MKRIVFLFISFILATCVFAQDKFAEMKFDSIEYDFGTFYRGSEKLSHTFTYTNIGKVPVIINQVVTTCGCTVAQYSKEPVAPGKKGTIKVVYNALGRFPGKFKKAITLKTNSKKPIVKLYIKGNMVDRQ